MDIGYINPTMSECITFTEANIIFNSRLLWREITFWSRAFFDSVYSNIGNTQEVFTQLFNTPNEYAFALRFILSRPTTERFISYFNRYVITLRELVGATVNGDLETIQARADDLYSIVQEQAKFFAEIFPALNEDILKDMLTILVDLQIEEINSYILNDSESQLRIFDEILTVNDTIADYLSYGIINLINPCPCPVNDQDTDTCITFDEFNVIINTAMFWTNLILWFREYRISVMAGLSNQEELYNRLIQTTVDYENSLKGFFDEEDVDYQMRLIREYIDLMNQLLDARLAGDVEEMNRIFLQTIDNIKERGEFSNRTTPLVDGEDWTDVLTRLNSFLINMSTQFLTGNYSGAIEIFNGLIDLTQDIGSALAQSLADAFLQ